MGWSGVERSGMERSGVEWNAVNWIEMNRSEVEWSGEEWTGMEWSGVEYPKLALRNDPETEAGATTASQAPDHRFYEFQRGARDCSVSNINLSQNI